MSRRIEIQLTSRTGDDQWTWRAAGAREPRGLVPATLVPDGTEVGAVVKAVAASAGVGRAVAPMATRTASIRCG